MPSKNANRRQILSSIHQGEGMARCNDSSQCAKAEQASNCVSVFYNQTNSSTPAMLMNDGQTKETTPILQGKKRKKEIIVAAEMQPCRSGWRGPPGSFDVG